MKYVLVLLLTLLVPAPEVDKIQKGDRLVAVVSYKDSIKKDNVYIASTNEFTIGCQGYVYVYWPDDYDWRGPIPFVPSHIFRVRD